MIKKEKEISLKSSFSPENSGAKFKYDGSLIICSQTSGHSDLSAEFHHHLNEINQAFAKFESKIQKYFMRRKKRKKN